MPYQFTFRDAIMFDLISLHCTGNYLIIQDRTEFQKFNCNQLE